MKKTSQHFLLASFLCILTVGHVSAQQPGGSASTRTAPPPLQPNQTQLNPKADTLGDLSALITADSEATLSAQMAGKIKNMPYGIGQTFPAGAILAEFDCTESQAKLEALNAEYLGARETHLAKLRLQGLGAAGDLEVTLAAAAAEKAKSQLKQQDAQIAFCTIRAPYAGRIVRLKAHRAESVAANQPVLEVVASSRLKATIHVPSMQAVQLKLGSPLTIDIKATGREYKAKVSRLNARVDGVSQSLEIEAIFVGATAGLLPGMIGQARF